MLHLIPAPLHRLALRIAYRLRARFRRRYRRPTFGVALVARDGEGRVLLVRHTYGSGRWALPGGGRSEREDPELAIRREMREELRCELIDLRLLRISHHEIDGAPNTGHIYTARLDRTPRVDGREVATAQWFHPGELPTDIVRISRRQIGHAVQDEG